MKISWCENCQEWFIKSHVAADCTRRERDLKRMDEEEAESEAGLSMADGIED